MAHNNRLSRRDDQDRLETLIALGPPDDPGPAAPRFDSPWPETDAERADWLRDWDQARR